ncbi:hypothetical protein ACFE04_001927 [Oxalis oulophora]
MKANTSNPLIAFDLKRDAYGFAVRPQHLHRFREYATIYKEEEEERSDRWNSFLRQHSDSPLAPLNVLFSSHNDHLLQSTHTNTIEEDEHVDKIWAPIRPSLREIEDMMATRVKKKNTQLNSSKEAKTPRGASEEDSDDEFYDVERSDPIQDASSGESVGSVTPHAVDAALSESSYPWKEEFEVLVRGGVPIALRGELWQAFVGVKARRVDKYYQDLLALEIKSDKDGQRDFPLDGNSESLSDESVSAPEKWKGQIEKDLPRTFPGHPALDDNGRDALRRVLTAYARHNPSVGYCQAMNFFAGLLLLLMPEENAFWALVGIIDDFFAGYYSEEMIESQVDQLVFEELVRERFPKLVNHLDYIGVQVAWVSGPWFLSIFINMLPWESGQISNNLKPFLSTVLRVWDVLLLEGSRVMLFKTALALMELYGPALVTTKDAGDAVTLLQSLAGSTFDSSQLVLTASMGYQNVNQNRLNELRNKHRPTVITALEDRAKDIKSWRNSQGLASKLYNFKHDSKINGGLSRSESGSTNLDEVTGDGEIDSVPDLQEQVVWLKVELCKLLEEKRSAVLSKTFITADLSQRAALDEDLVIINALMQTSRRFNNRSEELETALMEMVKQDNRRQLSAKIEQLEQEIADLQRFLADKQEQENAMLQVLMRVEQEQKVTEDARVYAEQDASAQRYAAQVLQEKYEEATNLLAEMEKRAVMAESMLEATLQYQSGQSKPSPRSPHPNVVSRSNQESNQEFPARKISLLSYPFAGWRDRSKGKSEGPNDSKPESIQEKPTNGESLNNAKSLEAEQSEQKDINGIQLQN